MNVCTWNIFQFKHLAFFFSTSLHFLFTFFPICCETISAIGLVAHFFFCCILLFWLENFLWCNIIKNWQSLSIVDILGCVNLMWLVASWLSDVRVRKLCTKMFLINNHQQLQVSVFIQILFSSWHWTLMKDFVTARNIAMKLGKMCQSGGMPSTL